MSDDAAKDIRRILNIVLALEAAFKAANKPPQPKPMSVAHKPAKPKPIKFIKTIKPVGPQPPRR